eukprot:m51a1_g2857 hypothetical protein (296) ;mRNA; r:331018-332172
MAAADDRIDVTAEASEDLYIDSDHQILRARRGTSQPFRIRRDTKLSLLKKAFCQLRGLDCDTLRFTFGGRTIQDESTCEDMFMVRNDTIWVAHKPGFLRDQSMASTFKSDFAALYDSMAGSDLVFLVGPSRDALKAHKVVVSARSAKLRAMFTSGMKETSTNEVVVEGYSVEAFSVMLKYLYTDESCATEDLATEVIAIADEYLLPNLKRQCELALLGGIKAANALELYFVASRYNAGVLQSAAEQFVLDNCDEVLSKRGPSAIEDVKAHPDLFLALLKCDAQSQSTSLPQLLSI